MQFTGKQGRADTDCAPAVCGVCLQVRHMLASHGRLHEVTQVILNPSEEPYFNVVSTMSNKEDVKVRVQTRMGGCLGTGIYSEVTTPTPHRVWPGVKLHQHRGPGLCN